MPGIEQLFTCTRCGYCCQGQTTVSLDKQDQERMTNALGLKRQVVAAKYWRVTKEIVQMQVVDDHCIFYKDGCTIHQARPWRCGEWPLHPAILKDKSNFQAIIDSCPGINREVGYEQFCEILRHHLAQHDRLNC